MPYVVRGRGTVWYEATGQGPAVVLLQGLALSSAFWFDVPATLAADHRVIVIDNRGTGRSRAAVGSLAAMADDVAAILDVEGLASAIVVGISMGGMIAQHVAVRHPARTRGLVLLASSPGLYAGGLPELVALARLLSLPFGGRRAQRSFVRLLLPPSKWGRAKEIFADWPKAMGGSQPDARTFAAHLLAATLHHTPAGRIRCPVLVVAGEDDVLMPKRYAHAIARQIPGAELLFLPDTGHALFAEDRDLVRRVVVRLEAKIDG